MWLRGARSEGGTGGTGLDLTGLAGGVEKKEEGKRGGKGEWDGEGSGVHVGDVSLGAEWSRMGTGVEHLGRTVSVHGGAREKEEGSSTVVKTEEGGGGVVVGSSGDGGGVVVVIG